jgi:hypothetical protein
MPQRLRGTNACVFTFVPSYQLIASSSSRDRLVAMLSGDARDIEASREGCRFLSLTTPPFVIRLLGDCPSLLMTKDMCHASTPPWTHSTLLTQKTPPDDFP